MRLFHREVRQRTPDFEKAVLAELPVLYRVAKRLTGNASMAEDLVAQTLLDAGKGWEGFDGRYPRSWFIMILRNNYRKHLRHASVRPQTESLDTDHFCSPQDLVEDLSRKDMGARLMTEVDKLPDDFKMAVVLCDVEEMSYEEAAKALGIPVGTVRSRLYRGRRMLRKKMAGYVEEPGKTKLLKGANYA